MINKILVTLICLVNFYHAQNLDFEILHAINKNEMPKWDQFMFNVSQSGDYIWPTTIIIPVADGIINSDLKKYKAAAKNLISIGLSSVVTAIAKAGFNRDRPFVTYPNQIVQRDHAGPNSFPSGHTTTAFASATALTLTYPKWYVAVPSYLYAGLVGYSRMRLGMHYPTDVITGAVIGTAVPLLVWTAAQAIERRIKSKHATVEP